MQNHKVKIGKNEFKIKIKAGEIENLGNKRKMSCSFKITDQIAVIKM